MINPKVKIRTNGIIAFATFSIGNPDIPDATNKLTPSGGVIIPISAPTTSRIPK